MENSTSIKTISIQEPTVPIPFFSPSSIVAIFNAATVTKEEKRIIQVRGIFKKTGTSNYGGNYYNRLKDEASDNSITLITSTLMHNQLDDNKTIEFNGFITRRLDKQGRIEIFINLIELISQKVNKFSEEETKKIILINKKIDDGFKDLDAHIKNAIFHNKKISIKIIMGKSAIIDSDIKKAMESSIALYDIEYHKISLSAPEQIIDKINFLDNLGADIICIARGGGENLEIFENLDICESILDKNTIIASAIGHAENVSLFEKLADKKFITPTQFGTYLKEIYNTTIEEFEKSKAKLVKDISDNLTANYSKQIQNLNDQLKGTKELHEKSTLEAKKNQLEQIETLSNKIKTIEELHKTQLQQINNLQLDKMKSLNEQVQNLQSQQKQKDVLIQQANNLASSYQKQLQEAQSQSGYSIIIVIIAAIIGIIIGVAMSGNH